MISETMLPSEAMTPQEVIERVRPYVARKKVGTVALSINEQGIHLRNGYWRIPICPAVEPEPLLPYYEALAELNDEIQDGECIDVTIESGDPLAGYPKS